MHTMQVTYQAPDVSGNVHLAGVPRVGDTFYSQAWGDEIDGAFPRLEVVAYRVKAVEWNRPGWHGCAHLILEAING